MKTHEREESIINIEILSLYIIFLFSGCNFLILEAIHTYQLLPFIC